MPDTPSLYFIAIIPPEDICEQVTAFKQDFAERFKSSHALKVVPHITLKAPFKFPDAEHKETLQWFEKMPLTVLPFQQELKDFGAFHNRYPVVYIKPNMNPALHNLQKEVVENFGRSYPSENISDTELRYSPHMTIGYRDLQPIFFEEAWKEYKTKKYFATFPISNIHLLQHDKKHWNTISPIQLG